MQDESAPAWRQTLDRHHTTLVQDLTTLLDREVESSVMSAVAAERQRFDTEAAQERERLKNEAIQERELLMAEAAQERERLKTEATREHDRLENEAARECERIESEAARERERIESEAARERERLQAEFAQTISYARTRASEESRLRLSESLNQTLRRIRHTTAEHETLQLLLEDSPADHAVVLLIENGQARIAATRAVTLHDEEADRLIDLSQAGALASCIESRDPVVALAAPVEISPVLASALASSLAVSPAPPEGTPPAKVYLFPITVRQTTVALMLAYGDVAPAPIELLCEAVGMKLESFEVSFSAPAPEKAASARGSLISIGAAVGGGNRLAGRDQPSHNHQQKLAEEATAWSNLTPDDQALHLRAQRFARVRVAQIRISESEDLRKGAQSRDIYSALRPSIDAARAEFARSFMSQSPTMVDYLHLEVIRSLAREDSRAMGEDYPGPIR